MKNDKRKNRDIVVYKNTFNTVPLRNFTAVEMDLLFTIMSQLRDKGVNEITFTFKELKELSQYNKETAIDSFIKDLESTYDKLIQLNVKIGTSERWTKFVFFTKYTIDKINQTVDISVNSEFALLINELTSNFTKFELQEITSLNSSYAKSCYRILKQFRKTGYYITTIEKFRYLLDVPESYNMSNLTSRVLKPIEEELKDPFKNLKINKQKRASDKRKVTHLEFIFDPESDVNKTGHSVFRDSETGKYIKKHIYDFTKKEIDKEFPDVPKQLKGQIDIEDL